MGIADAVKNLGEDIVASYNARITAIGTIVKDTRNTLKGFHAEHEKMSKKQAKDLEGFVADLTKNVANTLKGIQTEHKDMAAALKASLEKGETDRLKTFKGMMGDIRKDINEIETYVKNKLQEFSEAHAEMSDELKKDLAKYVADIVKDTQELLGVFHDEREKMAAHWQAMAATMAKKRGVEPVKVEAGAEVKTVEEVKVRPVEKPIEEIAEEEMPPEMSLEERVLEFINRHSKGVTVGDMEEPLGVVRMRLGAIAKKLLNEGKVRKEERLYFPL